MDSFHDIRELYGNESGKTALVIGGGLSAGNFDAWPDCDFTIVINGAVARLPQCRYFICTETDVTGDYINIETPAFRVLNFRWAKRMARKDNVYSACKSDQETDVRKVHDGIWRGPMTTAGGAGTSAIGALHLAGILGCSKVHSIGIDLCFKGDAAHHWYAERHYFSDLLAGCNQSLIEYAGVKTMPFWVTSARYMLHWRTAYAAPAGLEWCDYSDGLLQRLEHDSS